MTHSSVSRAQLVPSAADLADLAGLLRPQLAVLAEEIIEQIRLDVPEYALPLQGRFGAGLRLGVEEGLRQFVEQLAAPQTPHLRVVEVCRALGKGEFLEGRSLDALQAAYRIGARVAWRRFCAIGEAARIPAERMYILAEAVFSYIEQVSAHSVEAYSELRSQVTDPMRRVRQRLLELLTADPAVASPDSLTKLAQQAQWRLPRTVAVIVLAERWYDTHVVSPALGNDVLIDLERPDPLLLMPDPDGPGRADTLRHGLHGTPFAVGPSVPLRQAALSLRLARQGLSLMQRGIIGAEGRLHCDDHLPTLLLLSNEGTLQIMTERLLGDHWGLNPEQFDRLADTLLVWIGTGSSIPEVAVRLALHPQTIRYRMRKLQELFGDRLHDPQWRFEMALALRARSLSIGADGDSANPSPPTDRGNSRTR
ncbi:PucR family transcriptional regulator [Spirillospora sp. NPDC048911]|uniref:PucR family transcriptional regulator n=1 Tax=Spirillospora sp. NPDC048911 TaxID=3364527 RepID=UPI0037197FBC